MRRRGQDTLEALRLAIGAIRANKARGVLTTLGIVIGVLGVITTMTAANGLANNFRESVSALGTDVVYVSRMPWIIRGNFFDFRNRPRVSLREVERLESRLPHAAAINPTTHTERSVKFSSETIDNVDVIGTTDKQMLVSTSVPESGRFLTPFDVQANRRVCVIGSEIRTRLFAGVDPLNKQMKIGRSSFRVIGVMEKQGSAGFFGGPNFDSQVFVPITTFAKVFGGAQRNIDIAVKAPPSVLVSDFEYEVVGEMRKVRKLAPGEKDDFSINKMDSLLEMFNNVMGVVLLIGIVITGISLFVGGVGVMNIMFVSVTERTREIGIRKAIGARKRAILVQFLFESAAICLIGGLMGLLLAAVVTEVINRTLMPASISPGIVVVALLVSTLTGIAAGVVPAYRASRLDPIDALRYE
ncbi:MAG: ABC transporter permease [Thermoanaerobaculia bacterium]|jgi:putative ABC transport system permease protein|nr:ABC transporter permease [Thermoanaerobaculia bacterium]MBP9824800.1 ABC transporter permease [Thermoanaerobaculia bacterium]